MKKFFYPESVLIAGASSKPHSVGQRLAVNINRYGGKVYLINPKGGEVDGHPILKDIDEAPDGIDLGVVLVRADLVPETISRMADKGIDTIVIGTGGFSETGEAGKKAEKEVEKIIKERKLSVIGPNCVGLINTSNDLYATFLNFKQVSKGKIALVTQSGAYAAHVADKYSNSAVGFSKIISVGNQMDINIKDTIKYLGDDPETDVICLYFESLYEGREFIEVCRTTVLNKPVLATSGGHTSLGSRAASSHTGALASNSRVLEAVLYRAGVIYTDDFDAMFQTAQILAEGKIPANDNAAIVTNAGGPGVMTTDQLALQGLGLARLSEQTKDRLRESLHPAASVQNPIDMLAGARPEDYIQVIEHMNSEEEVGSIVVIIPPPPVGPMRPFLEAIIEERKTSPKPILLYLLGEGQVGLNEDLLMENRVVHYENPGSVVETIKALTEYRKIRARLKNADKSAADVGRSKWKSELDWIQKTLLLQELLIEHGVNVSRLIFAEDEDKVVGKAEEMGYPLVMKIAESEFTHKTDIGGVILGIDSKETLLEAFINLKEKITGLTGNFSGVFLQKMVQAPGQEVIIGAIHEPNFGPMVMFGGGGIDVELYGDVCFGLAPLDAYDVARMLETTYAGKKLNGIRNIPKADLAELMAMLKGFSEFVYQIPELTECELNPVIVHPEGQGATAVDFRFSEE